MPTTIKVARKYKVEIDDATLSDIRTLGYDEKALFDTMTRMFEMGEEEEIHWVRGINEDGEAFEGWVDDGWNLGIRLYTVSGWEIAALDGLEVGAVTLNENHGKTVWFALRSYKQRLHLDLTSKYNGHPSWSQEDEAFLTEELRNTEAAIKALTAQGVSY